MHAKSRPLSHLNILSCAVLAILAITLTSQSSASPPRTASYGNLIRQLHAGEIRAIADGTSSALKGLRKEVAEQFRSAARTELLRAFHHFRTSSPWPEEADSNSAIDVYAWAAECQTLDMQWRSDCDAKAIDFRSKERIIHREFPAHRLDSESAPPSTITIEIPRAVVLRAGRLWPLALAIGDVSGLKADELAQRLNDRVRVTLSAVSPSPDQSQFSPHKKSPRVTAYFLSKPSRIPAKPVKVGQQQQELEVSPIAATLLGVAIYPEPGQHPHYVYLSPEGEDFWRGRTVDSLCRVGPSAPWHAVEALALPTISPLKPDNVAAIRELVCKVENPPLDRSNWHLPSIMARALDSGTVTPPNLAELARALNGAAPLTTSDSGAARLREWLDAATTVAWTPLSHRRVVSHEGCLYDLRPDGSTDVLGAAQATHAALSPTGDHALVRVDNYILTGRAAWLILGPAGIEGDLALPAAMLSPTYVTRPTIQLSSIGPVAEITARLPDRSPETVFIELQSQSIVSRQAPLSWPMRLQMPCTTIPAPSSPPVTALTQLQKALTPSAQRPAIRISLANALDNWYRQNCEFSDPPEYCSTLAERLGAPNILASILKSAPPTPTVVAQLASMGDNQAAHEVLATILAIDERHLALSAMSDSQLAQYGRLAALRSTLPTSPLHALSSACDDGNAFDRQRCLSNRKILQTNLDGALIKLQVAAARLDFNFARRSFRIRLFAAAPLDSSTLVVSRNSNLTIQSAFNKRRASVECEPSPQTVETDQHCITFGGGYDIEFPVISEAQAEVLSKSRIDVSGVFRIGTPAPYSEALSIQPAQLMAYEIKIGNHIFAGLTPEGADILDNTSSTPVIRLEEDESLTSLPRRPDPSPSVLQEVKAAARRVGGLMATLLASQDTIAILGFFEFDREHVAAMVAVDAWRQALTSRRPSTPDTCGVLSDFKYSTNQLLACAPFRPEFPHKSKGLVAMGGFIAFLDDGIPWLLLSPDEVRHQVPTHTPDGIFWLGGPAGNIGIYHIAPSSVFRRSQTDLRIPLGTSLSPLQQAKVGKQRLLRSTATQASMTTDLTFDPATLNLLRPR